MLSPQGLFNPYAIPQNLAHPAVSNKGMQQGVLPAPIFNPFEDSLKHSPNSATTPTGTNEFFNFNAFPSSKFPSPPDLCFTKNGSLLQAMRYHPWLPIPSKSNQLSEVQRFYCSVSNGKVPNDRSKSERAKHQTAKKSSCVKKQDKNTRDVFTGKKSEDKLQKNQAFSERPTGDKRFNFDEQRAYGKKQHQSPEDHPLICPFPMSCCPHSSSCCSLECCSPRENQNQFPVVPTGLFPTWIKLGNIMLANHILNTQYIQALAFSNRTVSTTSASATTTHLDLACNDSDVLLGKVGAKNEVTMRSKIGKTPEVCFAKPVALDKVTDKSVPVAASAWDEVRKASDRKSKTYKNNLTSPGLDRQEKSVQQRDQRKILDSPAYRWQSQNKELSSGTNHWHPTLPKVLPTPRPGTVRQNVSDDLKATSARRYVAGFEMEHGFASDDGAREVVKVTSGELVGLKEKRSHRCIYCGKLYSRKYGLKIHIRTHTGYKPLKCKICGRPFGDPSNLNKHIRLHAEGETPYRCQFCGKVLVRRRDLERHVNSRHPEQKSEFRLKSELNCPPADPRLWAVK